MKGKLVKYCSWVKHVRELSKHKKRLYLASFYRRYKKILPLLEVSKIYTSSSISKVNGLVQVLRPFIVIVDDKIYHLINHDKKIREGNVKSGNRKVLVLLADGLANYARYIRKYPHGSRKLKELEK